MDDLFRRAAENAPLKEADSDWGFISAQLNNTSVRHQKTDRKRLLFFIPFFATVFMLSPLWLLETDYQQQNKAGVATIPLSEKPATNNMTTIAAADEQTDVLQEAVNIEQVFNETRYLIAEGQKKTATVPAKNELQNRSNEVEASSIIDASEKVNTQETIAAAFAGNKKPDMPGFDSMQQKEVLTVEKVASSAPASLPDTIVAKKPLPKQPKGWYAGIQAGTSFSMVKGQHMTSPGFTAGLAVGYKLSASWALETGLRFSEKKYYSNGEYFKPKKPDPSMPADMKVLSVNSKTMLLEIPLKAKYNFVQTTKGQYFFTGGINTFVVGKEINDYIIFRNGASGEMQATYNANKSYLAATIELSAGFEKYLKNKHTLRIEPWVQIAQKGIGVGQLPVSGFGIQAGYFFHK